jgi:hypothetical protein
MTAAAAKASISGRAIYPDSGPRPRHIERLNVRLWHFSDQVLLSV